MPSIKYIKLAQDYYIHLKKKGIVIEICYLFGSCLRGSNTTKSDIDILLVSDCFLFPIDEHIDLLYDITRKYNNLIHLYLLSLHKFKDINPNLNSNYFSICDDHIFDIHYPIFTEMNNKLSQSTINHTNIA